MEQATLKKCQNLIGYRFEDPGLLSLALTHASVAPTRLDSNERLEFLGDAVIDLVVSAALMERFPDAREGPMSRMRATMVNEAGLAALAREVDLGSALRLGRGEE